MLKPLALLMAVLLAALSGCTPGSASQQPAHAQRVPEEAAVVTAFVGATVFDGSGRAPIADAVVLLDKDRVSKVGPRSQVSVPKNARVVDVTGRWIVPGLVDSHVHFFQSAGLYTRPDIVDLRRTRPYVHEFAATRERLDDTFKRYLVTGVTAVADMGGPMWNFEVRERASRQRMAPRVAVAGPLVSTVARPQFDPEDLPILQAESPEHARRLVRSQLARKPDLVKMWGVVTPERTLQNLSAIAQAIIEEAHAAQVRVAVHATELETARAVAELGADILVHGVTDREVDDAFVALMKARGIITIPTMVVYQGYAGVLTGQPVLSDIAAKYGDPVAIGSWSEASRVMDDATLAAGRKRRERMEATLPIVAANVKRLFAGGAAVAAGTDAGNIGTLPGASLHDELAAMVRAGMPAASVLLAATRDAARVLQSQPSIGTLEPGKMADLLVIDGNPLTDIRNLQRLLYVVKGGVVLRQDDILEPNPTWVVDGQLASYNGRDLERFLSWYADDVVLAEHPSGKVLMRGKDEMRRTYGNLFAASPTLHCTLLNRAVVGSVIVDHELITGHGRRPYFHGAAIYEVSAGLIRRVWFLPKPD